MNRLNTLMLSLSGNRLTVTEVMTTNVHHQTPAHAAGNLAAGKFAFVALDAAPDVAAALLRAFPHLYQIHISQPAITVYADAADRVGAIV